MVCVCVFFADNSWHIYVNIPDRTAWMHAIENHFQLRYFLCTHLIFTFWPLFTACISFFHENYNCLLLTFGFHRKIVQNRLFWWYVTRAIFWNTFRPKSISPTVFNENCSTLRQWKLHLHSVTIEKLRISLNGPSNKFSTLKVGVCHGVLLYYVSFDFTLDIFGVSFLKLKMGTWNGINSNFLK